MRSRRGRARARVPRSVVLALGALGMLGGIRDAHAADNVFLDLVVEPTGFLVGDADDRFLVSGDFLNSSEQANSWSTGTAELVLRGSGSHVFTITGRRRGVGDFAFEDNFAWGTLRLEPGQSLVLQDGNATPGGVQYVRALILEDGVPQIGSITGNGLSIYYDPTETANAYLSAGTYPLAAGGEIAPFPVAVPSMTGWGSVALSLVIASAGVRALRARAG